MKLKSALLRHSEFKFNMIHLTLHVDFLNILLRTIVNMANVFHRTVANVSSPCVADPISSYMLLTKAQTKLSIRRPFSSKLSYFMIYLNVDT